MPEESGDRTKVDVVGVEVEAGAGVDAAFLFTYATLKGCVLPIE